MRTEPNRTVVQMRIDLHERDLIDQAASLAGMNRTQFMLSAAMRDAKERIADQSQILVDPDTFHAIANMLDNDQEPSAELTELLTAPRPWK